MMDWRPSQYRRDVSLRNKRNVEYRARLREAKKTKGDRLRCYRVWMTDKDVTALFNEMESAQWRDDLTHQDYRELGAAVDQQWIKAAGWVIEQAALSTIKKKNNRK
jgi:hypothetical protein